MKTFVKLTLTSMLLIGLIGCGTHKIVAVDLQVDPKPVVVKKVQPPKTVKIRDKVLFDFDSYKLDGEAMAIVQKVSSLMAKYPDTVLALEGYTDKYGPENYNMDLSLKRANAVKDALINSGVQSERIVKVEGFGKTKLIPNLTNRENRRVLILSIGDK